MVRSSEQGKKREEVESYADWETWEEVKADLQKRCLFTTRSEDPSFDITSIKIINQPDLAASYRQKLTKLRTSNGTEETAYCPTFNQKYLNGLTCKPKDEKLLGDPSKGIHLCRHPDVLVLKMQAGGHAEFNMIQCKIAISKKLAVNLKSGTDLVIPTPNNDAYVCRLKPSPSETIDESWKKSQVYVCDIDKAGQPIEKPRNILPMYVIGIQAKPQNSASKKPKLIPSNKIKKENPTEIPCPECGILFPSQYQVNEHIKYLHQNRRKCDQCDIICQGKRALNAHKKTHDSRLRTHDSAEYHCEDCNTVCKSKQALRWHKQKSHGYKIFNCKCPMCEATFSNGWSLYWHKKREHGVLKKEESYETQEKATHNVESFASPKFSLSDDSSADILQPISVNTHTKSSTCVGDDESNSLNDETSQGELEEDEDSDSQQISKNNISDIKGSSEHFISTSHDSEDIAETSQLQDSEELQEENSKKSDSEEEEKSVFDELQEDNSSNSDSKATGERRHTDGLQQDASAQETKRNEIRQFKLAENHIQLSVGDKQSIESADQSMEDLTPAINSSDPLPSNEIASVSDSPKLSAQEEAFMPMISEILRKELQNIKETTKRHHVESTLAHFVQKSKNATTVQQVANGEMRAAKKNVDVATLVVSPNELQAKPQVEKNSSNEEANSPSKDGPRKQIPRPPKESVCYSPVEKYIADDSETISKSTFSKDIKATSSPAQNQIQNVEQAMKLQASEDHTYSGIILEDKERSELTTENDKAAPSPRKTLKERNRSGNSQSSSRPRTHSETSGSSASSVGVNTGDRNSCYSRYSATPIKLKRKETVIDQKQFGHLDRELDVTYRKFEGTYKLWKKNKENGSRPSEGYERNLEKLFRRIEDKVMYLECVKFSTDLLQVPKCCQMVPSRYVQDVLDIYFDLKDPPVLQMPLSTHQKMKLMENCLELKKACERSAKNENVFELIKLLGERREVFQMIMIPKLPTDSPGRDWWEKREEQIQKICFSTPASPDMNHDVGEEESGMLLEEVNCRLEAGTKRQSRTASNESDDRMSLDTNFSDSDSGQSPPKKPRLSGDESVDPSAIESVENNPFSSPAKIVAYGVSDESQSRCTTDNEEEKKDVVTKEVLSENHNINSLANQLNHNANKGIGPPVPPWSEWYGYGHHRAPNRSFMPARSYNNPYAWWPPIPGWNQWNPWNPRTQLPMQNRPLLGMRPGAPPHTWALPDPPMFLHRDQTPYPPRPTTCSDGQPPPRSAIKAELNGDKNKKWKTLDSVGSTDKILDSESSEADTTM